MDERITHSLRLAESKALSRLGQTSAATALLVALTKNPDPQYARAALATLGAQKLRGGDSEAGYRLLNKAFYQADTIDWIGRPEAEADFALVLLMRGSEPTGLTRLHQAQTCFEATGDREALARSLWNEASYFDHQGRKKQAAPIWDRWRELERSQ